MPSFTVQETAEIIAAEAAGQQAVFSDVVTDTRKIKPGVLFVALKGERFNGEDFVSDAVAKGAAGIVVSRECPAGKLEGIEVPVLKAENTLLAYQQLAHAWRMKFDLPVVAITGSNGKTTTKDLTAAVLSAKWKVLKTQANFNNEIGLPLTLLQLTKEHEAAVVEIGMRGLGQISAMAPMAAPSLGIVTNVGETHMELLGSLENIAKAKSEMVEAVPSGGTVILNADNDYVAAMRSKAKPGVRVLTFGIEREADIWGGAIRTEGQKTKFMAKFRNERHEFTLSMVGRHNVYNALAAIAAGVSFGFTAEEIQRGLDGLEVTKMRFECRQVGGYQVINDAYNASPMSMTAAIDTLAEVAKGRKIAVMGDMLELGSVAVEAHEHVGRELAEKHVDALLTRGEMGEHIAKGAEESGMQQVYRCASHEEAGKVLHKILQPGDTVLFKGSRGMQMEKIIDLL